MSLRYTELGLNLSRVEACGQATRDFCPTMSANIQLEACAWTATQCGEVTRIDAADPCQVTVTWRPTASAGIAVPVEVDWQRVREEMRQALGN